MDRKQLLAERQNRHKQCTKGIKDFLTAFIDEKSFVENNEFFANEENGESVVCGQASIGGTLVYVVAQNSEVMQGGMSKRQAEKFINACDIASNYNKLPVVFVLDSCGGKIDEGIELLDCYSKLVDILADMVQPSICIVKGNALGSMALFAGLCDFVYMTDDGIIALNSPSVLAARENANEKETDLFGKKVNEEKSGLCSFIVGKNELGSHIAKLLATTVSKEYVAPSDAELNRAVTKIEKTSDVRERVKQLADKDSFIEIYEKFDDREITGFAKIGGYSVAILANNSAIDDGRINQNAVKKLNKFADLVFGYDLPLISLVDCKGIEESIDLEQSTIIYAIANLTKKLAQIDRVSLVAGNAIGLGYTLFASSSLGYQHSIIAWENAVIAPVEKSVGGLVMYQEEISKADDPVSARNAAIEKYETMDSDPYIAAQNGFVNSVIEAKNSRIYLISKLQVMCND